MTENFEKTWLRKFSASIERTTSAEIREEIMAGSEDLSDYTERKKIADWSKRAMARLDNLVDAERRIEIMTGCSCQYPKDDLQEIRKQYEERGDIDLVLDMLQEKFVSFLTSGLNLSADTIADIVDRGWGLAGRRDGNKIIATKIPKSSHILEYLEETDAAKKRAIYCHCPRIRDSLKTAADISATYCYCGAGYYKGIWEEILQRPLRVELLESVLKGDDVCRIAIHLS
jgi:predicted hydrocarbon binding protein